MSTVSPYHYQIPRESCFSGLRFLLHLLVLPLHTTPQNTMRKSFPKIIIILRESQNEKRNVLMLLCQDMKTFITEIKKNQ